ncbi:hypothetical protein [Parasulfuritortus cantonensis]|uniref:hypothetical protein n=1 Tax=Parasulfuritortus cantonensis TaxID=2528202 RepID=UPI00197F20D8|nr:hypothetical protein [Parasulfuritortus cantonensis]
MSLPSLFASKTELQEAFVAGLERQLAEPGLGTYILVLANASFDPAIWPLLRDGLARRFAELAEEVSAGLRAGRKLHYPDDDLTVFLKLMAIGFDAVSGTEWRRAGPWEIQYNPLRALRPARASGQPVAGCTPPAFNPNGFQFNKPFLKPEILWQGELRRHPIRLLYNKFPFADLHGLLVPEPDRQLPQRLSQDWHLYMWHLATELGAGLPGFGIAYNSYGGQASVNHLHFQTFVRGTPLPVAEPGWRHNGGTLDYPLPCRTFDSALEAWFHIEGLHGRDQPYNLVYAGDRVHCLARRPQGSLTAAPWSAGHAWYEMAGGVTTFNRDDYASLDDATVADELSRLAPVELQTS